MLNDVVALLISSRTFDFSQVPISGSCCCSDPLRHHHRDDPRPAPVARRAARCSRSGAGGRGAVVGNRRGRTKVRLFALSAGIAGFGGVLLALNFGAISNTTATPLAGLFWLALAVTFGIRRPGGALLAGLAFACASATRLPLDRQRHPLRRCGVGLVSSTYFTTILFGLSAIQLAKEPDGILALTGKRRLEKRLAKGRKEHVVAAEPSAGDATPRSRRCRRPGTARRGARTRDACIVPRGGPGGRRPHARGCRQAARSRSSTSWPATGKSRCVHDVTLHVPSGKVVALLGANGAGKSTLCSVAAGLVTPTCGTVMLSGRDVTGETVVQPCPGRAAACSRGTRASSRG